jgi:hypothetical protein
VNTLRDEQKTDPKVGPIAFEWGIIRTRSIASWQSHCLPRALNSKIVWWLKTSSSVVVSIP